MMIYLLKSSACIVLFYAVYLLLFRNTDRFELNRVYLLMGLVLSFVLPLIVMPATSAAINMVPMVFEQYPVLASTGYEMNDNETTPTSVPILTILYGIGLLISLSITFFSLVRTFRSYQSSRKFIRDGRTVAISPNGQPFSFFGLLFLRSADDSDMIVEHELVHVRQRHWIDLALVEIAAAVLWFNPCIYFYKRSIAIQHEYLADRSVVNHVPAGDYLHCLAQHLEKSLRTSLSSHFNTQSIKQRIMMITNTRTYSALRYAIALPVIVFLAMAFSNRPSMNDSRQDREFRSPVDVTKLRKEPGAGYGKRINPVTQKEQFHTGVDFVTASGNGVYAPAGGVVMKTSDTGDRGKFILVMHDNKLATSYSHLEKINVKEGEKVNEGQLIGLVGSTGVATGPHLHFEILKDGKAVDPVPYLDMQD